MPRLQDALTRKLLSVPPWAFLALAALLRLGFALKLGTRFHQTDELGFFRAALNLAQYGVIGDKTIALVDPPVPAAFFSVFYRLFGESAGILAARVGQAGLGTMTAWCLSRMTEDLTGSKAAGRWALAIASVYPFFIYYNGVLISESLYAFFIVCGLWQLCSPSEEPWRPALGGVCLSLAGLCRVEGVAVALLLWLGGGLACALGRRSWKGLAVAVLCWSLPLLAWSQRNKYQTGERVLDNHGGISLLHGTLLFDLAQGSDILDTGDAMKAVEKMPFYVEAQSLPLGERDKVYRAEAFRFMREHPGETLYQWGFKLWQFWRPFPRTGKVYHQSAVVASADAGLGRKTLVLISLLFEPWLIVLGFMGLWKMKGWSRLYPAWLFILGTAGIHMLVVSMMRYRLPVMPLLILGASSWLGSHLTSSLSEEK